MTEVCIENPERIEVQVDAEKYSESLPLENFIKPGQKSRSALIILNQKITMTSLFRPIWNSYQVKVCADGGANRLFEFFEDNEIERESYLPDYIIGDLDSLKDEVHQYYNSKGVIIIKQTTQYSTDFTKTVNLLSLHFHHKKFNEIIAKSKKTNHGIELESGIHDLYHEMISMNSNKIYSTINLLALGGIGGRFDQSIHSMTQFYNLSRTDPYYKLAYLTDTDLIIFIPAGGILVTYSPTFRDSCIGNCGLLPVGKATSLIETKGFKWDVENWETSIESGRVSSSNRFTGIDKCYINAKDGIVLNIEIFKKN
ncbi:hypothetical protein NCAS_0H02310 [Naumovozyma castellii]|uniref:Thiamine pyrophosphokinase n=1 Tax=Naumovozyma castellii TaxID=27288 RepID=G0VJ62_NAUCA|nr:hypothetical protein NCAS_0H02310 [Naumovozyma castellii CBS 4309]CCC71541.1 hypothetical protein NCAS_0H02310 [Naumovozyma castellii CBS 4309]